MKKDNKKNAIQEEILNMGEGVSQEPLFRVTTADDVVEEPLFTATTHEIDYVEPLQLDGDSVGYDSVFGTVEEETGHSAVFGDSIAGIVEEELNFVESAALDVEEEALFGVEEETINPEVKEEEITFAEPTKLDTVEEESLFSSEEETADSEVLTLEDSAVGESAVSDIEFTELEKPKIIYKDKKFAEKIFEQDPVILARYDELKNIILSYKGVKSRISNNYDSFNKGRLQLFKLATSGKSLKLYLNLEYDKVETRLKCKDVSDRNCYKSVPVLLRIKSDRAMRNAKYLIKIVADKYGLVPCKKPKKYDSIQLLKDYASKSEQ